MATALAAVAVALVCAVALADSPGRTEREGDGKARSASHWAYRPLRRVALPEASPSGFERWARTPIDRFLLARLAERELHPSPPAERRLLLRRLSIDLIGMPPTPGELDEFLADEAPDAFERVVDRLLASPHFGERWARHWMDVVHFAESHGHDQDRPREHAWPYRDYLIESFNADTPYGRFVEEQIAGDALYPGEPRAIVATGFIAAGPWDESSLRDIRPDSIDREIGHYLDRDDMVTTAMSTFVSTTAHCARCHDHKFDPVSQAEYYSLQAVFAGVDKANRTYDPDPRIAARRRSLEARLEEVRAQREAGDPALLDPELQAEAVTWEEGLGGRATPWRVLEIVESSSENGATLTALEDGSLLSGGERPEKDTYTVVARTDLPRITGIRLEVLTDDSLPHRGPGRQDNGNLHLSELLVALARPDAAPEPIALRDPRADFDQGGWTIAHAIDGDPATAWGIYPEVGKPHRAVFTLVEPIGDAAGVTLRLELRQLHGGGHLIGRPRLAVTSTEPPFDVAGLPDGITTILATPRGERDERQRIELIAFCLEQRLRRDLDSLPPPQLVYCGTNRFEADGTFVPVATPRPVHLLARGDISEPGPLARPQAPGLVPGLPGAFDLGESDSENEGARRAALGRWLSHPDNVLTWRSIANRLWHHHFGRGIVDTPNDFGRMGGEPTHPELLDRLALELLGNGGSLKALHRLIVTSAAYRQSSRHDARHAALDADNRFLWRMNRRRLDAETVRDAVLRIAGTLDTTMGGPSVKQFIQTKGIHVTPNVDYVNFDVDDPAHHRRSVYRFIFRTLPDPFMESLDCPDASQWTPRRNESVTALQALSLLNDKVIVRQSEHIAARISRTVAEPEAQVEQLFRLVLGRRPRDDEAAMVTTYTREHGLANACRFLLNTNEFIFVD